MTRRSLPAALLTLGLIALAPATWAHDSREDHGARIERHMEQAAQRLALTDAQRQQLRPVVEQHVAQARAIRDRYPAQPSREQKKQMFDELRAVREEFDTQMHPILTEAQRQQWETMRSEHRERMREHMRGRKERTVD